MPFVIDASITIAWAMPDETDEVADIAYDRLLEDEAFAPALWWYEVRNVLMANERRKRADRQRIVAFLAALERLPITLDHSPDEPALLGLAGTFRLTVYDAAYLELAIRRSLPLASLDRELLDAARSSGVVCLG
jgi:predicted nucleic acid-binding protein